MLYHGPASEIFVTNLPHLWGSLEDLIMFASTRIGHAYREGTRQDPITATQQVIP